MHVVMVRMDLHIPQSRSLKARRSAVTPIVEGLRTRYRLSAAEVDHHDRWQRAAVGFAVVSASPTKAVEVADAAEAWVWSHPEIEVTEVQRSWASAGDGPGLVGAAEGWG